MLSLQHVQLPGDGQGGELVVAGDHGHLHPCLLAEAESVPHLVPRRIYHGHQPQEDEVFFDLVLGEIVPVRKLPVGDAQDPQCVSGHLLVDLQYSLPVHLT